MKMRGKINSVNRKGFTLIELLIVMTILSILVGVVVLSVGNVIDTARERAYDSIKHQIQTATVSSAIKTQGIYPLTGNTTVIDGNNLPVIDVCSLIITKNPTGLLKEVPEGCVSNPSNDNCHSAQYNCSCDEKAHYIWAVDMHGQVYSSCINTVANKGGCENTGQDGYQGVWP